MFEEVEVLIDGDGYIFDPKLIAEGEMGGKEAARKLDAGIKGEYGTDSRVGVSVFLNTSGLKKALGWKYPMAEANFGEFEAGFMTIDNFIVVNVGSAPQAADKKMKGVPFS